MTLLLLHPIPPLLAEAPVLNTGTVLLALLVVAVAWLAVSVSQLRRDLGEMKEALAAPRATPRSPASVAPAAGPTPAEMAAIAAAIHVTLGAGFRVVSVVPPDASAQAWSREGRREVFQSHHIR
jgi:hypothetical protein